MKRWGQQPAEARQRHIVVFCKEPIAGRVKSRLARDVGWSEATRCQRVMLARLVRRLIGDPRWTTWLAVSPDTALRSVMLPVGTHRMAQGAGDLGQRMQRVFDTLPPGPAVIIGSDVPEVLPSDIAAAFKVLGRHDAVLGPSPDGGYWLVGFRRRPHVPRPFARIRWSSAHAFDDTMRGLEGYTSSTLRMRADVDDRQTWSAWRGHGLDRG